jgi:hypothetical protein
VAGVFSERFLLASAQGYTIYTVPPGKRAVVKSISCYNGDTVTLNFGLTIGAFDVWIVPVPGKQGAAASGLMLVAYSGEQLKLYLGGTKMMAQASGYLLDTQ